MKSRASVYLSAAIVALVFVVGLWLSGVAPELEWMRYYSIAVFLLVALSWAWDRWIWRWPLSQQFSLVPPLVSGTWKGTLASKWVDAASEASPPKTAYLVVRQTSSAVRVVLLTDEARSETRLARVTRADGKVSLDYMYVGEPDVLVEDRSRMHRGAASLLVSGSPATRLHGRYWTDRNSRGSLDLTEHSPELADDYASAEELFPTRQQAP